MKEKVTCGSHKKKNKKKKKRQTPACEEDFFFFSRFSLRYTEIGPSEFVVARRKVLYLTRATCEYQKHGISPSFQLKNSENLMFWFFSNLWLSDGQNWSEQEKKLIHAS